MKKWNEKIINLFNASPTVVLASARDLINVTVVAFKAMQSDGNILLYDVFMKKTLENVAHNPYVTIALHNPETMEGYQIRGRARYITNEDVIAHGNAITKQYKLTTKGALLIEPLGAYVLTPGPDNGALL